MDKDTHFIQSLDTAVMDMIQQQTIDIKNSWEKIRNLKLFIVQKYIESTPQANSQSNVPEGLKIHFNNNKEGYQNMLELIRESKKKGDWTTKYRKEYEDAFKPVGMTIDEFMKHIERRFHQYYNLGTPCTRIECTNYENLQKKENYMRCSACHIRKYCSLECQKSDWKNHKTKCQLLLREYFPEEGSKQKEKQANKNRMTEKYNNLSELD